MRFAAYFLPASLAVACLPALAYDPVTHAKITGSAVVNSVLADNSPLYDALGITNTINKPANQCSETFVACTYSGSPFGFDYFEIDAMGLPVVRPGGWNSYESTMMQSVNIQDVFKTSGLVIRGTIREDDNPSQLPAGTDTDDPNAFHREFNHFFDPVYNRPLTVSQIGLFYWGSGAGIMTLRKSVDWALGVDDAFGSDQSKGSDTLNHFTVLSAREAEWRALTGTAGDGGGQFSRDGSPPTETDRNRYWATMFRSVGDIMHLNQDAAQPQHTRNEAHSGAGPVWLQDLRTGHASVYEAYMTEVTAPTIYRAINVDGATYTVPENTGLNLNPSIVPQFPRYADYWSTAPGTMDGSGKGMADFSNYNFFTAAHGFGEGTFPHPTSNEADYGVSEDSVYVQPSTGIVMHWRYLTENTSPDDGTSQLVRLTRASIWRKWDNVRSSYTLDSNVYLDQGNVLVPRAVGYSAGLANFFFRGSLSVTAPSIGVYGIIDEYVEKNPKSGGFKKIKLRVTNTTPNGAGWGDQTMSGGTLTAVVKFHRNNCFTADLQNEWFPGMTSGGALCRADAEEVVASSVDENGNKHSGVTLKPGQESDDLSFGFGSNPIPVNAIDVSLQVIYRGPMGTEKDAIAVGTTNISEPTHATIENVTPNFVCFDGAWYKMNGNGSVSRSVQDKLTLLNLPPSTVSPIAYSNVQMAIQQHSTEPFYRMTDQYGTTLDFPLVEQDRIDTNEYIRFATLMDPHVPSAWKLPGFEYFDNQPIDGERNEILNTDHVSTANYEKLKPIVDVMGFNVQFGYLDLDPDSSTDCKNTPPPREDTGDDGAPYTAKKLVQISHIHF